MDYFCPLSEKEFSQKKLEAYDRFGKVINEGRKNPIWFVEYMYGLKLIDYQAYGFMKSWWTPYVLWLCSRRAGKTVTASVFLQAKMLLIPNYNVYISTNSAAQSIEIFKMIENIALQRVPSFATATDVFAAEVEKNSNNKTGFVHDTAGHRFRLPNNSQLLTLSTHSEANRGKGGSVFFDETAWQTKEQMAAVEHFANMDSSFKTSVGKVNYYYPKQIPLQLFYASSAGDIEFPFYDRYREFSKNMLLGDNNYFVFDLNVNTILNYSTINGEKIKPHITEEAVKKAIEDDPDAAERELFNRFRKGAGNNSVVKIDVLLRNSEVRKPILYNETGKQKFIFCYDPARNYDNSVLTIFELCEDKQIGYYLKVANVISMVDTKSAKKTPLSMPKQREVLKEMMIRYNGDAENWGNIELYFDSGVGGQATGGITDELVNDWTDSQGNVYKGVIDREHKQYQTIKDEYPDAVPIVHLIDPQSNKKIMYDALQKMTSLNLIKFMLYDKKNYIMLPQDNGDFIRYDLSTEEELSLANDSLMKTELSYMCRYETSSGNVTYELDRLQSIVKHDDRAYTCALGAYALALKRREELLKKPTVKETTMPNCVSSLNL